MYTYVLIYYGRMYMVIDLIAALPGVSCSRFPRKHPLVEGLLKLKADPNIIHAAHMTQKGAWVKCRTVSIPACTMESPFPTPIMENSRYTGFSARACKENTRSP